MKLKNTTLHQALFLTYIFIICFFYNSFLTGIQEIFADELAYFFGDISRLDIVHVTSILFFFFIGSLISGRFIFKYLRKLISSFNIFGSILQHYIIFGIISLFISSLLFNRDAFQSYFLFNGDFAIAIFAIIITGSLLSFQITLNKSDNKTEDEIPHEFPIQSSEQDKIGFDNQVTNIYTDIISLNRKFKSRIYLLLGAWGSGKTSLLNLLTEKIEENKDERANKDFNSIETIYFDVSQFEDTNLLYLHFYNKILEELSKRLVIPLFDRYRMIRSIVGAFGKSKNINSLIGYLMSKKSPEKNLKRISSWLYNSDLTFVVQVDEVDRLLEAEVNGVFKLLRLVKSNMYNIVIIFSTTDNVMTNHFEKFES